MEQPDSEPEPTGDRLDLGARAAQIFGPLLERDPWAATGFLVVSALMSLVWFTVVVAALAVSVPLMIIGIGIPLTVGVLALAARIGRIERSRANWIGRDIGEPVIRGCENGHTGGQCRRPAGQFVDCRCLRDDDAAYGLFL